VFTGIIEELGEIVAVENLSDAARFTVRGPVVTSDAVHGASIAVNGVCLTVVDATGSDALARGEFTADVMAESLSRSSLADLKPGDRVNLERPMVANGRFGGHIVQGHVDGTVSLRSRRAEGEGALLRFALPKDLARYVVEKGFITIDGVSLTVAATDRDSFDVALIPHTATRTTLGALREGASVNVETDIIGKYVERLLDAR
jgi:riboflavin synthase